MKAGITGHQNLLWPGAEEWVRQSLAAAVLEFHVTRGLTSLARGADQLFAEVLLEAEIPFTAIVPSAGYEQTFGDDLRTKYEDLLRQADGVENLGRAKPSERAFLEAGQWIVDHTDVVFAVWDGEEARGMGGTGDIVKYARREGRKCFHLNPKLQAVSILPPPPLIPE